MPATPDKSTLLDSFRAVEIADKLRRSAAGRFVDNHLIAGNHNQNVIRRTYTVSSVEPSGEDVFVDQFKDNNGGSIHGGSHLVTAKKPFVAIRAGYQRLGYSEKDGHFFEFHGPWAPGEQDPEAYGIDKEGLDLNAWRFQLRPDVISRVQIVERLDGQIISTIGRTAMGQIAHEAAMIARQL